MPVAEIFQRTLKLENDSDIATGILYVDPNTDSQYIITAKHFVNNHEDAFVYSEETPYPYQKILVHHDVSSSPYEVECITYLAQDTADVAVLQLRRDYFKKENILPLSFNGSFELAEDAYFCGFPHHGKYQTNAKGVYDAPVPFIKKTIISAADVGDQRQNLLHLDGYNHPGFSGGPLLVNAHGSNAVGSNEYRVIGIVSHYVAEDDEVNIDLKSGIFKAYHISHAFKIIDASKKHKIVVV